MDNGQPTQTAPKEADIRRRDADKVKARRIGNDGSRRTFILLALGLTITACTPASQQATSRTVVAAARLEREVVIYANTSVTRTLADGFMRRFPEVRVRILDMNSNQMHQMILAEAAGSPPVADLAWSSAMDGQIKLINDGYALTYRSHEARNLPSWAVWRDQGFGLTAETIGFAYNRRLIPQAEVPRSHADLLKSLQEHPDRWRGRVSVYDPVRSGVAFLHLSEDTQIWSNAWALMDEIGRSRPTVLVGGEDMMEGLATGRSALAYNINQPFASWWIHQNNNPDIAVVTPSDYHLSISRVAFILRSAPHPNAAKLFLDYAMSEEGQGALGSAGLPPARAYRGAAPGDRPVRVGPALLANLDQERRRQILSRWAIATKPPAVRP